ncbi:hypothetical protein ACJX0J_022054, partial [Zea mays]
MIFAVLTGSLPILSFSHFLVSLGLHIKIYATYNSIVHTQLILKNRKRVEKIGKIDTFVSLLTLDFTLDKLKHIIAAGKLVFRLADYSTKVALL